jgi:hypothetical protein
MQSQRWTTYADMLFAAMSCVRASQGLKIGCCLRRALLKVSALLHLNNYRCSGVPVTRRRHVAVSRFRHGMPVGCGVFQYTTKHRDVSASLVSKNCSPTVSPCPLSGNVLILVAQVGFVSYLFVKLDRILCFFNNRGNAVESLDSDKTKQNLISLPRRWKRDDTGW